MGQPAGLRLSALLHAVFFLFLFFFFGVQPSNFSLRFCRNFLSMCPSSYKNDEFVLPWYRQGRFVSNVGYFKAAYVKINADEMFRDFLEAYKHVILFGVCMKRAKECNSCEACGTRKAFKFHCYNFVLGFNFPMPRFFQEVICSMKCALAHCSPNVVRVMVGFHNLSRFFDLDLTQLRSCHRLFDHSSKWVTGPGRP